MNFVLPVRILLIALAMALCGYAGLLLAIPPGYVTAIFPPPGIALAALLAWGYGLWPGVWLGSFCLNVLITFDKSGVLEFGLPAAIAVGTTLQAVAGTWMVRRFVGYPAALDDKRSIALFFLCGAITACVISASIGVSSLLVTGAIGVDEVAYSWWTWYVGDALGVLIVAPLTLIAIGEPRPAWSARRVNLAVPLVITLALVVILFVSVSFVENQRQEKDFLDSVRTRADQLQGNISEYLQALESVERLFASTSAVDRDQFKTFVARILERSPEITALSWNPRITAGERTLMEARMQVQGEQHFQIREQSAQGSMVPARRRAEYVPVAYIEPAAPNEIAMGFDVASERERRLALERARDTGRASVSAALNLVQNANGSPAPTTTLDLLAFHPVYERDVTGAGVELRRRYLRGYVAGGFRIEDLLQPVLNTLNVREIGVLLEDVTDPLNPHVLFRGKDFPAAEQSRNLGYVAAIEFADRHWRIGFATTPEYLATHRSWRAWIVLAAGVLFAGLLGSLLLLVTGRGVRVQQLVDQRGTELRQAKNAMIKNEQLVRAAFEASPVGMLVVDAAGCIEEASARLPAMFGYTREALLGRPVETLLPEWSGASLKVSARHEAEALRGAVEQRGRRADGSEFLVDVMKNAMSSDDGTRAVASVEDITERKRVEALEKQKIRLETELTERDKTETAIARKNRELETLLHVTSHDLKEPLRAIESFSRLVHERYGNHIDEKGQDFLRRVVNAAQRMNRLLDEILNLSRAQRMGPPTQAIESENAVREALKRIDSALIDSGVRLRVQGDLPKLMADATWVTEAVYNLVVNALKFKCDGQVPDIEIAPYRSDGELGIVVRDRGPGVAPEHAERIFELFQRAVGREIEGTGAGLAIVRLVAEQHGGRAWVQPREGGGSEFIITFASSVSTKDG